MNRRDYGAIEPGMPADFTILDYDAMAYDVIAGMLDELDVLLTRSTRKHVRDLFVNGRQILQDARLQGIDLASMESELLAQAHAQGASMRALRPVLERSQATLGEFYRSGGHLAGR
jgi:cytosine/adenosine deaminase-related metal-dependent hydrolase